MTGLYIAKSQKWEYWKGDGQPPAEGGWEQSDSGSWRRTSGGGKKDAAPEKSGGVKGEKGPKNEGSKKPSNNGFQEEEAPKDKNVLAAELADHQDQAQSLVANMKSHLDLGNLSELQKEKIQRLIAALSDHEKVDGELEENQGVELQEIKKLAGDHGEPAEQVQEAAPPASEEEQKPSKHGLLKAAPGQSGGIVSQSEEQERKDAIGSYSRHTVGEGGRSAHTEDKPDVGRNWRHGDEEDPKEVLKSLTSTLRKYVQPYLPTELETQFLVEELGYDKTMVRKGMVSISGRNRHAFNEWLHTRLEKSLTGVLNRF